MDLGKNENLLKAWEEYGEAYRERGKKVLYTLIGQQGDGFELQGRREKLNCIWAAAEVKMLLAQIPLLAVCPGGSWLPESLAQNRLAALAFCTAPCSVNVGTIFVTETQGTEM